jgi:hypothetical protein
VFRVWCLDLNIWHAVCLYCGHGLDRLDRLHGLDRLDRLDGLDGSNGSKKLKAESSRIEHG